MISSGTVSPDARSYTVTSPPSTDTPKSRISKSGDSAYLYTPHFFRSTLENDSISQLRYFILGIGFNLHEKTGGRGFVPAARCALFIPPAALLPGASPPCAF